MSAASLINKNGQLITVKRALGSPTWVDGEFQDPPRQNLTIKAYIGQMEGRQAMVDAEGDRAKYMVKVYSVQELFIGSPDRPADRLIIDGNEFEVTTAKTYKGKATISEAQQV